MKCVCYQIYLSFNGIRYVTDSSACVSLYFHVSLTRLKNEGNGERKKTG